MYFSFGFVYYPDKSDRLFLQVKACYCT